MGQGFSECCAPANRKVDSLKDVKLLKEEKLSFESDPTH